MAMAVAVAKTHAVEGAMAVGIEETDSVPVAQPEPMPETDSMPEPEPEPMPVRIRCRSRNRNRCRLVAFPASPWSDAVVLEPLIARASVFLPIRQLKQWLA